MKSEEFEMTDHIPGETPEKVPPYTEDFDEDGARELGDTDWDLQDMKRLGKKQEFKVSLPPIHPLSSST